MNGITLTYTKTVTLVENYPVAGTGTSNVDISHTARFTVKPGTLKDLRPRHRTHCIQSMFRPTLIEAEWINDSLRSAHISGPRVLRNGGVSPWDIRHLTWRPVTFPMDYVIATLLVEYQRQRVAA